jgi:hypothetical protein
MGRILMGKRRHSGQRIVSASAGLAISPDKPDGKPCLRDAESLVKEPSKQHRGIMCLTMLMI